MKYKFPLMKNNILKEDLKKVIQYLKKKDPFLTQKFNVKKFEKEWSKWLGVKYSVFVNSGSSANLLSMALLKLKYPKIPKNIKAKGYTMALFGLFGFSILKLLIMSPI